MSPFIYHLWIIYGSLPICNVHLKTKKPCYIPLPDPEDKSLGAEFKRARLALEWTQEATAKHFRVGKDSYQKWEWNQIKPHIKNRKRVVEFLGYNFWDNRSNTLANKVLIYRIEHGLTMGELSQITGVSTGTIERIEKYKILVSQKMSKRIEEHIQ